MLSGPIPFTGGRCLCGFYPWLEQSGIYDRLNPKKNIWATANMPIRAALVLLLPVPLRRNFGPDSQ